MRLALALAVAAALAPYANAAGRVINNCKNPRQVALT